MATITIPKTEFDIIQKRASLYDAILRSLPEKRWGIERYSSARLKEFARTDRLDGKTRKHFRRFLASRK